MQMIRAIVFDLDNTLYDQKLFNLGAFVDVSDYISKRFGIDRKTIYEALARLWLAEPDSPDLFDKVLPSVGVSGADIVKIVDVFHSHRPKLKLYPGAKGVLSKLKARYALGMLTDGMSLMQRNKIAALGLKTMFDEIVLTAETDAGMPKPDKASYEHVLKLLRVRPDEAVYVGDNPKVDFVPAKKIGMATVRIMKGRFKNAKARRGFDADYKIKTLNGIFNILDSLDMRG